MDVFLSQDLDTFLSSDSPAAAMNFTRIREDIAEGADVSVPLEVFKIMLFSFLLSTCIVCCCVSSNPDLFGQSQDNRDHYNRQSSDNRGFGGSYSVKKSDFIGMSEKDKRS